MKVLITGANGQLGRALQQEFDDFVATDVKKLDITDKESVDSFDWHGIEAIINAAAYTNVDACELPENKAIVQKINIDGVKILAEKAKELDVPFVHISTDYVFDGSKDGEYHENDEPNPISEYGKNKLESEQAAKLAPKHYIIRTSWVIGDGHNFVKTMLSLAQKGINPSVVNDQIGRPTFTPVLAQAISHLLSSNSQYGTYNVTNDGEPVSWAGFAKEIYEVAGKNVVVTGISTDEYFKGKENIAPRPKNSVLYLDKSHKAGIITPRWKDSLKEYLSNEAT